MVGFCAAAGMGLLAAGRPALGASACWGVFLACFGFLLIRGMVDRAAVLAIAVAPMANLYREFLFYNVVVAIFAVVLGLMVLRLPPDVRARLTRVGQVRALLIASVLYYAVSFGITRDYSNNLRFLEFAFSAGCWLAIGRDRALLRAAILGMALTCWTMALAMLPHNMSVGRLGVVVVDGYRLGNPVQLGLALAFTFLAISVDRGAWVGMRHQPALRIALLVPTAALLALTTSRVSWLVAASGMALVFVLGQRQRWMVFLVLAMAAIAIKVALLTSSGELLAKGFERTFSEERDLGNRTSGRSDQWMVAYRAFTSSPSSLLIGYGPGLGPTVYAKYSLLVPNTDFHAGEEMALHSLFMQVAVEAGLAGLIPLCLWLIAGGLKIYQRALESRWVLPLACYSSFVLIVLTVSGSDTTSGAFLAMGLLFAIPGIRHVHHARTARAKGEDFTNRAAVPAGRAIAGGALRRETRSAGSGGFLRVRPTHP